jgi:hypothetical protein
MSDMGFMPQLATETSDSTGILPYRFVKLVTNAPYCGAACTAITDPQIGVTDGSVYQFGNPSVTQNSVSGTPINLQPSNTVQIELGGTVQAGNYLMPKAASAGVAVVAAGATAVSNYVALEGGDTGQIIKAFRFGQRGPVFA